MNSPKKLHWSQRLCLIRHNLHVASRTGDFCFFKALQAQEFTNGVDHMANLRDALGDDADSVLSNLDNLNAVIAYVHEDAFRNVYDSIKASVTDRRGSNDDRRSTVHADAIRERLTADSSIDKMLNSAAELLETLPSHCQEEAAMVLILGTTFIADAMQVCLCQIEHLESSVGDFIRHEDSWSMVQCAVGSAVTAIKGVFSLMSAGSGSVEVQEIPQRGSRSQSIDSFARGFLRKMSTSLGSTGSAPSSPSSRRTSITPATLPHRSSISAAFPSTIQSKRPLSSGTLCLMTPIPATPGTPDNLINPFDRTFYESANISIQPVEYMRPRAPSSVVAPHETVPSLMDMPALEPDSIAQAIADCEMTASPASVSPASASAYTTSVEAAPESPNELTLRRRRSGHVQGSAPDLESLFWADGTVPDEGATPEAQGDAHGGQVGLMQRLSFAFAGAGGFVPASAS